MRNEEKIQKVINEMAERNAKHMVFEAYWNFKNISTCIFWGIMIFITVNLVVVSQNLQEMIIRLAGGPVLGVIVGHMFLYLASYTQHKRNLKKDL